MNIRKDLIMERTNTRRMQAGRVPLPVMGGGGGVRSPRRRSRPACPAGARLRFAAVGAALVALASLSAAPPASAAPNCTPAGTGTVPTVTYSSDSTGGIVCDELTGGLTLTVEEGVTIGTQASPANPGIYADGKDDSDSAYTGVDDDDVADTDSAGANNITIVNSGTIYATTRGISVGRDGTGKTRVEHKAGKIVATGAAARGINAWHNGASMPSEGIEIVSSGDIDLSAATGVSWAIYAQTVAGAVGRTIPISVDVTGGTIKAGGTGSGINIYQRANGAAKITTGGRIEADKYGISVYQLEGTATSDIAVTATKDSVIEAGDVGILAYSIAKGGLTVVNSGRIEASNFGIQTEHSAVGKMMVTHNAVGRIVTTDATDTNAGIHVLYNGKMRTDAAGDTRSIEIVSAGAIVSESRGIVASAINDSGVDKKIPITVHVKGGTVAAGHNGIEVKTRRYNQGSSGAGSDHAGGKITVTVDHGATVTSKKDGIYANGALLEGGMRAQTVTVRGKVMGGGTTYAGVHMVKGGTVVIGPKAHVGAASGVAIKANAEGDMTVILEQDAEGLTGHVDGTVLNSATTTFKTRVGADGTAMDLKVGGMVDRRGEAKGVYDLVHRLKLATVLGGHKLEEQSQTRLYHDRARVYEALPSVLLDLNGQMPYHDRMAAPRDGNGVWARLAAGDGARRPASATTAQGLRGRALAWDVSQYGIEGGFDFPIANKRLLLGVSLHARQGEATVAHGGTIDVSGFGGGVSATYRDAAGFYLDGRFSYTYFNDIDLTSRTRGAVQSDLSGSGSAFGLEAGQRLSPQGLAGVALTPRARFVLSSVDADDFDDLAGMAGSGRVALETATSFKGRIGLLAETAFGAATLNDWTGDGGRLFGSLDVEHEFLVDREIQASGTDLASEVQATWGRVGFGGAFSWNDGLMTLSGEGFYATASSDNTDFGGSLTLTLRF